MNNNIINVQDETVKKINNALDEIVKPMEQNHADNDYPWIVFSLDDTEYAINTRHVLGVNVLHEIVPYTGAPAYCPGVIWDRKGIIRLLDLRVLLGRGNYLFAIERDKSGLPMIIIIEPDGKRRGMIVDRIARLEYANALIEDSTNENRARSRYIKGLLKYNSQKEPAFIISPESFNSLEFEDKYVKIDWKGRIDIDIAENQNL